VLHARGPRRARSTSARRREPRNTDTRSVGCGARLERSPAQPDQPGAAPRTASSYAGPAIDLTQWATGAFGRRVPEIVIESGNHSRRLGVAVVKGSGSDGSSKRYPTGLRLKSTAGTATRTSPARTGVMTRPNVLRKYDPVRAGTPTSAKNAEQEREMKKDSPRVPNGRLPRHRRDVAS